MTFAIEFRRRQNGQTIQKIMFAQRCQWQRSVDHIVEKHGLVELDNNKRPERRWWNGNGIVMAAYQESRISSVLAVKEAERLMGEHS